MNNLFSAFILFMHNFTLVNPFERIPLISKPNIFYSFLTPTLNRLMYMYTNIMLLCYVRVCVFAQRTFAVIFHRLIKFILCKNMFYVWHNFHDNVQRNSFFHDFSSQINTNASYCKNVLTLKCMGFRLLEEVEKADGYSGCVWTNRRWFWMKEREKIDTTMKITIGISLKFCDSFDRIQYRHLSLRRLFMNQFLHRKSNILEIF